MSVENVYEVLAGLLGSANLDSYTEAKDCLSIFEEYDWQKKPECDTARFLELMAKGDGRTMSITELNEFMTMVADEGGVHTYYYIVKGHDLLEERAKEKQKR